MDNLTHRFSSAQRIMILLLSLLFFSAIGSLLVMAITRNGETSVTLRCATVIQDCIIFIAPAIATSVIISTLPAKFLCIDKKFGLIQLMLAVLAMIVSIPFMNCIVKLNADMTLPDALSGVEAWMMQAENKAQESVEILLGGSSFLSLAVNLLIVGVLAGLSEELFFRGALQRVLGSTRINPHAAIWLTALIFSAFHMQFFGFIPRLLLGAFFGYLLYWSGSLWLPAIIHALNNSLVVYTMWLDKNNVNGATESLNNWGENSPALILASLILTIFILRYLYQYRRINN